MLKLYDILCCSAVVWLSLVERFVRDEEVAGSNPVTAIKKADQIISSNLLFYFVLNFVSITVS